MKFADKVILVNIVQVYAFTKQATDKEIDIFYEYKFYNTSENVIGDLNAEIGHSNPEMGCNGPLGLRDYKQ